MFFIVSIASTRNKVENAREAKVRGFLQAQPIISAACCKPTAKNTGIHMEGIFVQILAAFFSVWTICEASVGDDVTESCVIPARSGKGFVAFTCKMTTLFKQTDDRITVLVHVDNVYRRDAKLTSVSAINAVERAASCGHQHKQGDLRLWVTKQNSSGMFTAVASFPVTMQMVDNVRKALPGRSVKEH